MVSLVLRLLSNAKVMSYGVITIVGRVLELHQLYSMIIVLSAYLTLSII